MSIIKVGYASSRAVEFDVNTNSFGEVTTKQSRGRKASDSILALRKEVENKVASVMKGDFTVKDLCDVVPASMLGNNPQVVMNNTVKCMLNEGKIKLVGKLEVKGKRGPKPNLYRIA